MKKLILILLLGLCSVNISRATTVLCIPTDTCQIDWIRSKPYRFDVVINGCSWNVEFYIRKDTCNNICNFTVVDIQTLDSACYMAWQGNETQLVNIASASVIQKIMLDSLFEHNGFAGCTPDSIGECTTFWRQSKAQCWGWYLDHSYNPGETDPENIPYNWYGGLSFCGFMTEVCCEVWYEVCRDQLNQIVVTEVQTIPNPATCPPGCITVCGEE